MRARGETIVARVIRGSDIERTKSFPERRMKPGLYFVATISTMVLKQIYESSQTCLRLKFLRLNLILEERFQYRRLRRMRCNRLLQQNPYLRRRSLLVLKLRSQATSCWSPIERFAVRTWSKFVFWMSNSSDPSSSPGRITAGEGLMLFEIGKMRLTVSPLRRVQRWKPFEYQLDLDCRHVFESRRPWQHRYGATHSN